MAQHVGRLRVPRDRQLPASDVTADDVGEDPQTDLGIQERDGDPSARPYRIRSGLGRTRHANRRQPRAAQRPPEHMLPRVRKSVEHHAAMPFETCRSSWSTSAAKVVCPATHWSSDPVRLLYWRGRRCRGSEIDMDKAIWTIPAARMKAGVQHRVPLSPRALEILRLVSPSPTASSCFPAARRTSRFPTWPC